MLVPDPLTMSSRRKDWKRISAESSPDDPIGQGTELNWTELERWRLWDDDNEEDNSNDNGGGAMMNTEQDDDDNHDHYHHDITCNIDVGMIANN